MNTEQLVLSTSQTLTNSSSEIFNTQKNLQITIPRWNAGNGKQCAIRLTSGSGVLVELISHEGDYNAGTVYARKPMVRTIAEAAKWIVQEEDIWMDRNAA